MADDGNKIVLTNVGHIFDHPEAVAWGPDGRAYAGGELGQVYRFGLTDKTCDQLPRSKAGLPWA